MLVAVKIFVITILWSFHLYLNLLIAETPQNQTKSRRWKRGCVLTKDVILKTKFTHKFANENKFCNSVGWSYSPFFAAHITRLHKLTQNYSFKNCPTPSNRSALMFCKEKDQTRDAASQHNRKREKKRIT